MERIEIQESESPTSTSKKSFSRISSHNFDVRRIEGLTGATRKYLIDPEGDEIRRFNQERPTSAIELDSKTLSSMEKKSSWFHRPTTSMRMRIQQSEENQKRVAELIELKSQPNFENNHQNYSVDAIIDGNLEDLVTTDKKRNTDIKIEDMSRNGEGIENAELQENHSQVNESQDKNTPSHRKGVVMQHKQSKVNVKVTSKLVDDPMINRDVKPIIDDDELDGLASPVMIHPLSDFRRNWDLLVVLLLVYNSIMIPFMVAFTIKAEYMIGWKIMDRVIDSVFVFDIFLNFTTGIEKDGIVIMNRKIVRSNYIKGWFWIDFISAIPFEVLSLWLGGEGGATLRLPQLLRMMKLMRLIRVFRVLRVQRIMARLENALEIKTAVVTVGKFASITLLASHWYACAWYFVASLDDFGPNTWVSVYGVSSGEDVQEVFSQYVYSLYWSLTTMTTVGYGDITPHSRAEIIFSCFALVTGSAIFAYGVTNIVTLVASLNTTSAMFKRRMDDCNDWMKYRHLPKDMKTRVRAFMNYRRMGRMLYLEKEFLSEMSASLRTEVIFHFHRKLIDRVPFFRDASASFIVDVLMALETITVGPGDLVTTEGEPADSMFIIDRGTLEVYKESTLIRTLNAGDFFGELGLLSGGLRTANVMSQTWSDLYKLSSSSFFTIVNRYPDALDRILKAGGQLKRKNSRTKLKSAQELRQEFELGGLPPSMPSFPNTYTDPMESVHDVTSPPMSPKKNSFHKSRRGSVHNAIHRGSITSVPWDEAHGGARPFWMLSKSKSKVMQDSSVESVQEKDTEQYEVQLELAQLCEKVEKLENSFEERMDRLEGILSEIKSVLNPQINTG